MQLVTYNRVNQRFFEKGSAPSKKQWTNAILKGEIQGKVVMGKVWIDIDDFVSRDIFNTPDTLSDVTEEIDLLYG